MEKKIIRIIGPPPPDPLMHVAHLKLLAFDYTPTLDTKPPIPEVIPFHRYYEIPLDVRIRHNQQPFYSIFKHKKPRK